MRRIASRDTSPEMIVRRLVYGMGYRYRLHVPALPGKLDLVLTRLKKIFEVRGRFWHQHGDCVDSHVLKSRVNYWLPKLQLKKERDLDNLGIERLGLAGVSRLGMRGYRWATLAG